MNNLPISDRATRISQSEILRILDLAKTMKDVIHLEIGEPDLPTPDHIVRAAAEAAASGFTRYSPTRGDPELRAAIAEKVSAQNRIPADPATDIIVTSGAMGALACATLALLNDGDEVILPDPGWSSYAGHVALAGAKPVHVRLHEEQGFAMDPGAVRSALTPRTRMIVVNSPSNPTGGVIPGENLVEIARTCAERGVYVISDEVYESLVFEGRHFSPASLPGVREWVITVNSFSKTYSMTGWRVGYAVASPRIISAMALVQEHLVVAPSSVSQRAALAALRGPQDCVQSMRTEYRRRRDLLVEGLNRIAGFSCRVPPATFYAFAGVKAHGMPSSEFAARLLKKAAVATVPGSAFGPGGEGYLRVSFANSETRIRKALERIEKTT